MPLPEDSILYVRVWARQECVACRAVFEYLRRYTVMRRDLDYHATVATAEADYQKHALMTPESCPCPHCGWIQPDMAGSAKALRLGAATFCGFLLLLVSCIAAGIGILPGALGCLVTAGIVVLFVLFALYQLFANPNRQRSHQLAKATQRIDAGSLRLVQPGGKVGTPPSPVPFGQTSLALGLSIFSILAFVSPMLLNLAILAGQLPGVILFLFAGSRFANIAFDFKQDAFPAKIVDINSELVTDERVPEDFQKR